MLVAEIKTPGSGTDVTRALNLVGHRGQAPTVPAGKVDLARPQGHVIEARTGDNRQDESIAGRQ